MTSLPDSPSTSHKNNFNEDDPFEYCDRTQHTQSEYNYKDPEHN